MIKICDQRILRYPYLANKKVFFQYVYNSNNMSEAFSGNCIFLA